MATVAESKRTVHLLADMVKCKLLVFLFRSLYTCESDHRLCCCSFVAGEYGFLSSANEYALFLSDAEKEGCAGSLVWSLRPHAANGGFKVI